MFDQMTLIYESDNVCIYEHCDKDTGTYIKYYRHKDSTIPSTILVLDKNRKLLCNIEIPA